MTIRHRFLQISRTTTALAMTTVIALTLIAAIAVGFADRSLAADGAWVKQTSGTTKHLNAVFFVDQTTGWAVGNDATVLHTIDGGATWTAQSVSVGVTYDLTGVDFIDSMTGWVTAGNGSNDLKVLHTTDGGANWVPTTIPNVSGGYPHIDDVDFVDADHGLVAGWWAKVNPVGMCDLSVSGDGGTTWSNIDVQGVPSLADIEWADSAHVVAVGDTASSRLALVRSEDEGASWQRVNTGVSLEGGEAIGNLLEVDFVDVMHGWAVSDYVLDSAAGNGAVMLFTSDGGASWQHRHWSEMGLTATNRPRAIDFVDLTHGWMIGGPEANGRNTWRTADGGLTWQVVALPEVSVLQDVDFVSDSCGWAVGWDGRIFHYASVSAPVDTTPPVTTASGYDAMWHKGPVTVTFAATDNAGGSGVDYTEYKIDSGSWTRGAQVTIPAPARGANDGLHTVSYRSADKSAPANLEAVKACQVKIDTVGPVGKAKNVAVKRGKVCKLRFYVGDAQSEQVTTVIRIKTLRGVTKKTFSWGYDDANHWWTTKYKATLKKGTYRYYVYGNDLAGNKQSVVGWAKLRVK